MIASAFPFAFLSPMLSYFRQVLVEVGVSGLFRGWHIAAGISIFRACMKYIFISQQSQW
eukprot:m.54545 g.54545  ORF g.54545 m.54545 type:complete len:59 (+) comp7720_c0_seq9:311-487(+)